MKKNMYEGDVSYWKRREVGNGRFKEQADILIRMFNTRGEGGRCVRPGRVGRFHGNKGCIGLARIAKLNVPPWRPLTSPIYPVLLRNILPYSGCLLVAGSSLPQELGYFLELGFTSGSSSARKILLPLTMTVLSLSLI